MRNGARARTSSTACFSTAWSIGGSGLHQRIGPNGIEIGYWIHVDHVRRGYASEVSAALTEVAFTVDGIERVEIHHDRGERREQWCSPRRSATSSSARRPPRRDAPGEEGVDCTWAMVKDRWRRMQPTASSG